MAGPAGGIRLTGLVTAAGLEVVHQEILPKAMEFAPWVARMEVDAATTQRLRSMLEDGTPAFKAFLKPHLDAGTLWFNLDEAILIARKPA